MERLSDNKNIRACVTWKGGFQSRDFIQSSIIVYSKKITFYGTLNLALILNYTVILTPSCDQTFRDGLDLTCSLFWGLNSDDFPFFEPSLALLETDLCLF